jgi:hypothetical protein
MAGTNHLTSPAYKSINIMNKLILSKIKYKSIIKKEIEIRDFTGGLVLDTYVHYYWEESKRLHLGLISVLDTYVHQLGRV